MTMYLLAVVSSLRVVKVQTVRLLGFCDWTNVVSCTSVGGFYLINLIISVVSPTFFGLLIHRRSVFHSSPQSEMRPLRRALADGVAGGFHGSDRGHRTHSTDGRVGQLSVQVRERKTSRVAAFSHTDSADKCSF